MIRSVDLCLALVLVLLLTPLLILLYVACFIDSKSPIFVQQRVGRYGVNFGLLKFRTMALGTPNGLTHEVSTKYITRLGNILRRTKLDELPQLVNVIAGNMSFVGPRPGLPCDRNLSEARKRMGLLDVRPGITGLAQIHGVDMSLPAEMLELDKRLAGQLTLRFYFYLLFSTIRYVLNAMFFAPPRSQLQCSNEKE